jgi:hypothetical protein
MNTPSHMAATACDGVQPERERVALSWAGIQCGCLHNRLKHREGPEKKKKVAEEWRETLL